MTTPNPAVPEIYASPKRMFLAGLLCGVFVGAVLAFLEVGEGELSFIKGVYPRG
jgi:hypothetical protein